MTPEQDKAFQKSLKQTQEKSQRMIERMDKTLQGVRETIGQIQQNQKNIEEFKNKFGQVMTKLAQKISGSLCANPFKKIQGKQYEHLPVQKSAQDVVKYMMQHDDILIMTGAGVSAPSGIPTFRGVNGLYSKKFKWEDQQIEPQAFITKTFYDKHPESIWEWIEEIYKMATTLKPNQIHILIDKLAKVLSARGKRVTIITQNIDDFHLKPQKQEYKYYACHGNVKEVRCDNNHLFPYQDYRKQISIEKKEVKCPKCELPLRPHVLFFDQSYGQLYGGDARQKQYPFAFVIGTSLSTGLCARLTQRAKEVVEINPEPVIEVGKVYQFKKDTSEVLTQFLKFLGQKK